MANYVITEDQLDTILGKYKPHDFEYYKRLAEPFRYKSQFMKKHPKEYYLAAKAGIVDDLKDWDTKNNIKNLRKGKMSEQQYELYQKYNNYPDDSTPVGGEIVWRALTKANDNLGEALRLVQLAMQYTSDYPGLEEQLNEISNDISCGANRVIDCGPEACNIMGRINLITRELGYIKRDNVQSNTIGE